MGFQAQQRKTAELLKSHRARRLPEPQPASAAVSSGRRDANRAANRVLSTEQMRYLLHAKSKHATAAREESHEEFKGHLDKLAYKDDIEAERERIREMPVKAFFCVQVHATGHWMICPVSLRLHWSKERYCLGERFPPQNFSGLLRSSACLLSARVCPLLPEPNLLLLCVPGPSQCKRTSEFPVGGCRLANHTVRTVSATKRFFECNKCGNRVAVVGRAVPTACSKCNDGTWRRCGAGKRQAKSQASELVTALAEHTSQRTRIELSIQQGSYY